MEALISVYGACARPFGREVIMSLGMHAQGRTRWYGSSLRWLRCRGFRARQFRKPICKLRRYVKLLDLSCVRLALCLRTFQLKVCHTLW